MGSGVSTHPELDPEQLEEGGTEQPQLRNNGWVFRNKKDFYITREIINGESGWIIGKVPNCILWNEE